MLTSNGQGQLEAQCIPDERSIGHKRETMVIRKEDDFEPPRLTPLVAVAFVCLIIVARIRVAWNDCMGR